MSLLLWEGTLPDAEFRLEARDMSGARTAERESDRYRISGARAPAAS